jgi:hypothetical protein
LRGIMQLKEELKQRLSYFSYLTMSGEINISYKSYNALIISDSEIIGSIKSYAKMLSIKYPRFKIQLDTGISETAIKIFAYRTILMNGSFLEEMRTNLEGLLSNIYDLNELQAKLTISGYIDSYKGRHAYVYLNNERKVKYEMTQFTPNSSFLSKVNFVLNRTCDD